MKHLTDLYESSLNSKNILKEINDLDFDIQNYYFNFPDDPTQSCSGLKKAYFSGKVPININHLDGSYGVFLKSVNFFLATISIAILLIFLTIKILLFFDNEFEYEKIVSGGITGSLAYFGVIYFNFRRNYSDKWEYLAALYNKRTDSILSDKKNFNELFFREVTLVIDAYECSMYNCNIYKSLIFLYSFQAFEYVENTNAYLLNTNYSLEKQYTLFCDRVSQGKIKKSTIINALAEVQGELESQILGINHSC